LDYRSSIGRSARFISAIFPDVNFPNLFRSLSFEKAWKAIFSGLSGSGGFKMDINHVKQGEITIVTISGRLDADAAPVADKTIRKILQGDCLKMLFDFSTLNYLSSGGLRIILQAAKELKRKQGQIVLCCLSEYVSEVFEISGFKSLIPITDTVESGIKQLDKSSV
jgi:anti-anti-sigma factor